MTWLIFEIPATGGRGLSIQHPHRNAPPSWFHVWRHSEGLTVFAGRLKIEADFFAATTPATS